MAKKITDKQKEIVIAMRQTGESFKKCADAAKISESAARRIVNGEKPKRTEAEKTAEETGKENFVENAWKIINEGMELVKKRLFMAQADAGELMDIIEDVIEGRDLDDKARNKLVFILEKQAREFTVPGLKELGGIIDVMHEKQALMTGASTQNLGLTEDDRKLLKAVNGIE
ncbi:MAG: hypothetical protein IKU60_03805 [Clostridia bacterium]|nr:hypothetical protein [Clostridia bacterium]